MIFRLAIFARSILSAHFFVSNRFGIEETTRNLKSSRLAAANTRPNLQSATNPYITDAPDF